MPKTTRALSGSRTGEYPHPYRYLYTDVQNAHSLPEPEGMRVPFGWRSIVIPPAGSDEWPLLSWKKTWRPFIVACFHWIPYSSLDGWEDVLWMLSGAAQSNRFGETLQRDDYRVIYQMGMGLMGQLAAALES